ncbi:hypothetical protein C8J57DRAFT_1718542 [Mycena rebaudengoi]|nr:hypothetical protein C8J57DRAFT_1718542 [Mycena rebaudengoi]
MPSGRMSQQTPEQLQWLESRFADFCYKQARNTLVLFWPKMERDWFKEWPVEADLGMPLPQVIAEGEAEAEVEVAPVSDEDKRAIGAATADRKKKLRGWFNNRSQKEKNKGGTVKAAQLGEVAAVLFKGGITKTKKKRAKQPIELFQKRYPQRIEAEMQNAGIEDTEFLLSLAPDESGTPEADDADEDAVEKRLQERLKSARLKLRREVTRRLYDELGEEEQLEIETMSEAMKAGAKKRAQEMPDGEEPEEPAERTPEEYQAEIDALPGILREVHATIERKIMSKTYCFGVSPAGNTLVQAIPEWEEVITKKMGAWLARCNPRELRKSRAITAQAAVADAASTSSASVPDSNTGNNNEAVVPPKKVRKRKPPKKTATASAATAPAATEEEGLAASHLERGASESDLGTLDPNIDPVLLGLSTERTMGMDIQRDSTHVAETDGQRQGDLTKATDANASRPTPRATYKGAAAAAVRLSSDLVEAFGEVVPISSDEATEQPRSPAASFKAPNFIVTHTTPPRWHTSRWHTSSLSTAVWGETTTSPGAPTPTPGGASPATPTPACPAATSPPSRPTTPRTSAPASSAGTLSMAPPITTPRRAAMHTAPPLHTSTPPASTPLSTATSPLALTTTAPAAHPVTSPTVRHATSTGDGLCVASPASPSLPLPRLPAVTSANPAAGDGARVASSAPPSAPPPRIPAATSGNPAAGASSLTWDNFPQSRPLANAPTAPSAPKARSRPSMKGKVKGKGKEKGKENPQMSSGGTIPRKRKAEEAWRQTYDDDGNVIPLDPGAPMEVVSRKRRRELLDVSKSLDKQKEVAEALKDKTRRMLENPDGNYPAVIWAPPPEVQSGKRTRKPARDRDGQVIVAWEAKRSRGELRSS